MTVFEGFEDLTYFNKKTILIFIIIYIIFYYLTDNIYQSCILALSILYIDYRYNRDNNIQKLDKEYIYNYGDKINALDDLNLDDYQQEIINTSFPKSKYINDYNNKTIKNFIYLNQEFYYYNKQSFIDMVANIDSFLSIYEDIVIDNTQSGKLYNILVSYKKEALLNLRSIKISCPDKKQVIQKINNALIDLEKILNRYLYDVYLKNDNYIKTNGYNTDTQIIQPMMLEGYLY